MVPKGPPTSASEDTVTNESLSDDEARWLGRHMIIATREHERGSVQGGPREGERKCQDPWEQGRGREEVGRGAGEPWS